MRIERQLLNNRAAPLDLIYLTPDGKLDVQKSLLQLRAVAEISKQARFIITLHSTNLISQEALAQLIPQFQAALGKSEDANMVINYAPTTSESLFGDAIFYLSTR